MAAGFFLFCSRPGILLFPPQAGCFGCVSHRSAVCAYAEIEVGLSEGETAMSLDFVSEAQGLNDQLVSWRRDFHMYPELGFEEVRSAGIIADYLEGWGYQVQTGIACTGVVAVMDSEMPGPVVMLRFDMDALRITELNEVSYASRNPGVMHACGHDAHMAIGLGVAKLIADHRAELAGTVKLVFQPGEEGLNGAEVMVQEGVLEAPRPDVFLSVHVWNDVPAGTVGVCPGPVMAAAETWSCVVSGRGGHGALPHQTVDPIVASAQIVTALQTIVSRNVSPFQQAVVTVGSLRGGDAFNVIPATVEMKGTIRTYDPAIRTTVLDRMREIVDGVARASGVEADLKIDRLSPALVNDPEVTEIVREAAKVVVGEENVASDVRTMGSEDAAFFAQEVPGCYFFLGSANADQGWNAPHHNARFDIDEAVLPIGVAILLTALGHYVWTG